ncbi:hypothetical protein PRIPAC_91230 [Pristionchus pacificus]|uniref:Uncharacterized protein n=1 Tax=Pristionchus pacificus TaxID=54126 RepID=A0A2A6CY13_PRIPA|nr:hypothetical protein PRIPAC_91230 [Pristionchus pacificus]|eukprot:PDM82957.1 hypothetical protein PRIPAC_37350 [Pristionchus pacificus]
MFLNSNVMYSWSGDVRDLPDLSCFHLGQPILCCVHTADINCSDICYQKIGSTISSIDTTKTARGPILRNLQMSLVYQVKLN